MNPVVLGPSLAHLKYPVIERMIVDFSLLTNWAVPRPLGSYRAPFDIKTMLEVERKKAPTRVLDRVRIRNYTFVEKTDIFLTCRSGCYINEMKLSMFR